MAYLWLKAFHIMAVVTWFAALFYLPRLFVYHAMAHDEGDQRGIERFRIMERKLYRGIMTPSVMAVVLLGGALLALNPSYYFSQGWMHAKLTLVAALVVYHIACGREMRRLVSDTETPKPHRWYRIFNELPVLGLVAIVILVVVRPWSG